MGLFMKIFLITCLALMLGSSFAYMYPVYREIRPGIMLNKYRHCPHDCSQYDFLNQHDAYLCPQSCRH
jgi:hypothetical protein